MKCLTMTLYITIKIVIKNTEKLKQSLKEVKKNFQKGTLVYKVLILDQHKTINILHTLI